MQKGDVVLVDYTVKDLTTNKVFDTTVEAKARLGGVFEDRVMYKPVPIILGKNEFHAALEDEIEKMKVGETQKVVLQPLQAFGERKPEHIQLASMKDFRERKMTPYPGMMVEANGVRGRVQSVSGGRVRIDFNHPLAGKILEYEVSVQKKLDSLTGQASVLFDKFFPFVTETEKRISEKNGEIEIELPERVLEVQHLETLKKLFSQLLTKDLKGVSAVRFVETRRKEAENTKAQIVEKVEFGSKAANEKGGPASSSVPKAAGPKVAKTNRSTATQSKARKSAVSRKRV